jgi:1-acyl-sn-glycerol-3-phosphate acyltransferase
MMLFMYRPKFKNKQVLKQVKKQGYYIYANHVIPLDPIIIPVKTNPGKACIIISSYDAFSIHPIVTWLIKHFYTIPIPSDKEMFKNYVDCLSWHIKKKHRVLIFPEAHIWPYYTEIRPFVSGSFRYPVNANKPVVVLTNTYVPVGKKGKRFRLVTHIDGPFYPDLSLDKKDAIEKLRNEVYDCMVKRSKEVPQFEHYRYIDRRTIEVE